MGEGYMGHGRRQCYRLEKRRPCPVNLNSWFATTIKQTINNLNRVKSIWDISLSQVIYVANRTPPKYESLAVYAAQVQMRLILQSDAPHVRQEDST